MSTLVSTGGGHHTMNPVGFAPDRRLGHPAVALGGHDRGVAEDVPRLPSCSSHRQANVCRIWWTWKRSSPAAFRTALANEPGALSEKGTSRPTWVRTSASSSHDSGIRAQVAADPLAVHALLVPVARPV